VDVDGDHRHAGSLRGQQAAGAIGQLDPAIGQPPAVQGAQEAVLGDGGRELFNFLSPQGAALGFSKARIGPIGQQQVDGDLQVFGASAVEKLAQFLSQGLGVLEDGVILTVGLFLSHGRFLRPGPGKRPPLGSWGRSPAR
jgi:hypothetical protein